MLVTYYKLQSGLNMLDLSRGAQPLSAFIENGYICLAVLETPSETKFSRNFRVTVVGENFRVPHGGGVNFIGMVVEPSGNMPYFVFEEV